MIQNSERARARTILIFTGAFWGLSFPVTKAVLALNARLAPEGAGAFHTFYALAPRFVLAAVILLAVAAARFRPILTRHEGRQGLLIGLFTTVAMLLQIDGLRFTSASTSAFLTTFYAILIPGFLALRRRRAPSGAVWIGCILVLAGAAVLGHVDWHSLRLGRGECETLLGSAFFAGQILTLGHPAFARNRPLPMTLMAFAVMGSIFAACAAMSAPDRQALLLPWQSAPWVGCTLMLALICSVAAFLCIGIWQPKVTPTEAGLIYCFEPVFTALLVLFLPTLLSQWAGIDYPNERATVNLLLGGGLITAANVLLQLRGEKA